MIFGRDFKLEAADPYLFYAYQFRRATLQSRLIVVIGYGFADSHINKMLIQALRTDEVRKLVVVSRCEDDQKAEEWKQAIARILEAGVDRIVVEKGTARSFLTQDHLGQRLVGLIPQPQDSPF